MKENTIALKLEALKKLQSIDSKIDNIKRMRGVLPEEVQDLEDEIAGLQTRLNNQEEESLNTERTTENNKVAIKNAESLIKKYGEQQMNVRNNREYDAITKEIELQELEIKILEKRNNEVYAKIDVNKEEIEKTKEKIVEKNDDLEAKKKELEEIIKESEIDEIKLEKERKRASKKIEERLLIPYNKIRKNMRNGLAVISIKRGACGGCFSIVPPQRQAEVRERKKIIVCEHCGRIVTDVEDIVVEEKPKKRVTKTRKTTRKTSAKKE